MRALYVFILLVLSMNTSFGQLQLTQNFLIRTFNIKYGNQTASCFMIRHKDEDFIVTAKHVFANHSTKGLFVNTGKSWFKLEGQIYFHSNNLIDIAVFKPTNLTRDTEGISLEDHDIALGDTGYFLGFPYGMVTEDNGQINSGFPMPFIKKATLSSMGNTGGVITLALDGLNNPGFSGGPVILKNLKKNALTIAGVISGYRPQQNKLVTPLGTWDYHENSGIIVAYGTKHVIEIIESIK